MLVIISDLHLTDGSSGPSLAPGATARFLGQLQSLATAASWRMDGSYRPVERLDLVLLGDIVDLVHSAQWNARAAVRPWSDPQSGEFLDLLTRITEAVLAHNEDSLSALRSLSAQGLVIPPETRLGQPGPMAQGQPLAVRTFYMVGNHDWFFHLPGASLDALREKVIGGLGLAGRPGEPFPHDMQEHEDLLRTMRRHKVTARHGDLYDPLSFDGDRDTGSVSDALVIELVNRFSAEMETRLAGELPAPLVLGLREIDSVRPLVLIPVWLEGLLQRTCALPSLRKKVETIWDQLADDFLAIDFLRQRSSADQLIDGLAAALKFSRRPSTGWAAATTAWFHGLRGADGESYGRRALAEQDFRNRRSKQIVYGHTHVAESVPLDASYAETYVLNQVYFNAGTWRRVHRPTLLASGEHEFVAEDVMTYLIFYQGDERQGRPYETWSGTLGHQPAEATVHRIDPPRPAPVVEEPMAASAAHIRSPHFSLSLERPGIVPSRRT
jgi:UDP-2,3-diacylglucosamine pyrophosphatase LpxH